MPEQRQLTAKLHFVNEMLKFPGNKTFKCQPIFLMWLELKLWSVPPRT